ncbi:putative uncharacterized protein DDB_G0291608 [Hydractinia symbiolongicarpus]|uniref:putative uncharacterized protein DDB_G0291608 n=1 Tax=Hydractinia symbiolongicarpus TaxID=13093 RepID=UPI00254A1C19|nr:putative uncharacterized protein DDB_G0291608 [Hydractinia symbiolongicarpus]
MITRLSIDQMIFYIILLYLRTCHNEIVTRFQHGDQIKATTFCREGNCKCGSSSATYYNFPGDEKCIHATDTECALKVVGDATNVPMITQSMLHHTELKITKEGENFCSSAFRASSVRILALANNWQEVPMFFANSISTKLKIQELTVQFRTIWPGLLIKLEVKCKESNEREYTPRENCVLFKYEGTATYPLNLTSFEASSLTTAGPSILTTTHGPAASTTTSQFSTVSNNKIKGPDTSSETYAPSISSPTTHSKPLMSLSPSVEKSKENKEVAMATGIATAVILILVVAIIILIYYKKKLDRRNTSTTYTETNIEEINYDQINQKQEGEEKEGQRNKVEFSNQTYGYKIDISTNVEHENNVHETQKRESHYYNTNELMSNSNYYNMIGGKEMPRDDNKPMNKNNAENVKEYEEIWDNNIINNKRVGNQENNKNNHGYNKTLCHNLARKEESVEII